MARKKPISPIILATMVLLMGLAMSGCKTIEPVSSDQNISYETSMSHVDSLDKGGRWLSLGIKEINEIDGLSDGDRITINHHLFSLIKDEDLRFDDNIHKQFTVALRIAGVTDSVVKTVERAHIRVSSPLNLHDGYWVTKIKVPGTPAGMTVINDMHVDAATGRVTVYAQSRLFGKVVAPAQVSPGEFTELPNGERVGFHPNAVYLNGNGGELAEADGTGAWWVKHSWKLGGEGYYNWELKPQEDYGEGLWVEGRMLEDGLTMKIGDVEGRGFNTRAPIITGNSVKHRVIRFGKLDEAESDSTPTAQFTIDWEHRCKKSAFNGLARSGPKTR